MNTGRERQTGVDLKMDRQPYRQAAYGSQEMVDMERHDTGGHDRRKEDSGTIKGLRQTNKCQTDRQPDRRRDRRAGGGPPLTGRGSM